MFRFFSGLFSHKPVSSETAHQVEPDPHENSCCICYRTYGTGLWAEDPVTFACGHVFGATCIDKWSRTNSTCPLCRAELDFADDTYGDDLAAPTQGLDASFSQAEGFSWDIDTSYDTESGMAFSSVSEAGVDWLDAQDELAASQELINPDVALTVPEESILDMSTIPEDIITPSQVMFDPSEDIFITASHEDQIFEALPSIPPSFVSLDDKLFDFGSSDCFDELQDQHEQWMTECLEDEDTDDEDAIGYFDVFPY